METIRKRNKIMDILNFFDGHGLTMTDDDLINKRLDELRDDFLG